MWSYIAILAKHWKMPKKHKEQWDRELASQNSQLETQKAETEKLRDNLREYEHGF